MQAWWRQIDLERGRRRSSIVSICLSHNSKKRKQREARGLRIIQLEWLARFFFLPTRRRLRYGPYGPTSSSPVLGATSVQGEERGHIRGGKERLPACLFVCVVWWFGCCAIAACLQGSASISVVVILLGLLSSPPRQAKSTAQRRSRGDKIANSSLKHAPLRRPPHPATAQHSHPTSHRHFYLHSASR